MALDPKTLPPLWRNKLFSSKCRRRRRRRRPSPRGSASSDSSIYNSNSNNDNDNTRSICLCYTNCMIYLFCVVDVFSLTWINQTVVGERPRAAGWLIYCLRQYVVIRVYIRYYCRRRKRFVEKPLTEKKKKNKSKNNELSPPVRTSYLSGFAVNLFFEFARV